MKFHGAIGYGHATETAPGVWQDVITEKMYSGDVLSNTRKLEDREIKVNADISVGNSISVVADGYIGENFFAIRYIRWAGTTWTVTDVKVQAPRLLLRLGGVYNGPTA